MLFVITFKKGIQKKKKKKKEIAQRVNVSREAKILVSDQYSIQLLSFAKPVNVDREAKILMSDQYSSNCYRF